MEHTWKDQVTLPQTVTHELAEFCKDVTGSLGNSLDAIILFGDAAKGEYCAKQSDINVMLAFQEITIDQLTKLTPCITHTQRRLRLGVMMVSHKDLRRSTDVFPIKFRDIQSHHVLMWGKDVLQDLEIQQEHMRLRAEQELKNMSMRLRAFYIQRSHRPEQIESTLTHSFSAFLLTMDALLFLKQGKHVTQQQAIIDAIGKAFHLDTKCLKALHEIKRGNKEASLTELKDLYAEYMDLVDQAADIADAME